METIGRIRTIAFDKTGTLTCGRPEVTDVLVLSGSERTVLGLAASVESGSSHPTASAIIARAKADGIPVRPAAQAHSIPGRSITARIAGRMVSVASSRHMAPAAELPAEAAHFIA